MANITLKQLRTFVAVAESGRFRLAAETVNLTQSAVSILIKELEGQLGVSLFDRHTRFVGLTDAGRRLLPLAIDILDRVNGAVDSMIDISALKSGRVTVASAVVLAATYLPGRIAGFMRKYPDIRIDLRDVSEDEIRQLLMDGEADIAIGTSRFLEHEINEHELFVDHLALFCPADHPLAGKQTIGWADFDNQAFIALTPENPMQRRIDDLMEMHGVTTRRQFSVRFSTTLLALVNEGLGIGILPSGSKGLSPMVNIVMRPITDQAIPRNVVALTLRERALSPAARSFFLHLTSESHAKAAASPAPRSAQALP